MKTLLLFLLTSCTLSRDIQVHSTTGVVTEIKEGMRGNERVFFVTWKDSGGVLKRHLWLLLGFNL